MSQKEDSKVDDALCKPGAVGEFICYFKIVLVDPQLNFLVP